MLILDFDGVLCDALTECAAVTWCAGRDRSPQVRSAAAAATGGPAPGRLPTLGEAIRELPSAFLVTFGVVRGFARTLADFMVAHGPAAGSLRTQRAFTQARAAIPEAELTAMVASAERHRSHWRRTEPEQWLDAHHLYPGVADLLHAATGPTCVVTAKDALSVRRVLSHHGLAATVADVVGDCSDKAAAVQGLAGRRNVAPADVTFVDDNVDNALQVAGTGARVRWAEWGYHAPEHRATARAAGLISLQLKDLSTLTARTTTPGGTP